MPKTLEEVRQAVSELSDADRELLSLDLMQDEGSGPGLHSEWIAIAKERQEAYRRGEGELLDVDTVVNELRAKYKT